MMENLLFVFYQNKLILIPIYVSYKILVLVLSFYVHHPNIPYNILLIIYLLFHLYSFFYVLILLNDLQVHVSINFEYVLLILYKYHYYHPTIIDYPMTNMIVYSYIFLDLA